MSFITKRELYSSKEIKLEAKAQLSGHWKKAVLLAMIPVLFSVFFVSEINPDAIEISARRESGNLLLQIINSFLLTGVSFTFLDFIRGEAEIAPLEGVLSAFKKEYFAKLLLLKIVKYIYIFLWTLLLVVPGIVKSYGYSQAEFLFKDTVDRTGTVPNPRDCLKQSEELMMGHKMDFFSLGISFIGWIILSLFTFGLLYIWLTPYMEMSGVVFYENLVKVDDFSRGEDGMTATADSLEEVGKDPDDFSDFEDF